MSNGYRFRAIETVYNGYRFRSRLEARWAVFFGHLGVKYSYELQGFELGGGLRYLPDFWLSDLDYWFEVKPELPETEAVEKAERLARGSGHPVLMSWNTTFPDRFPENAMVVVLPDGSAGLACWYECPECGSVGIDAPMAPTTPGALDVPSLPCGHLPGFSLARVVAYYGGRILAARTAARQARFEHGELG